MRSGLIEPVTRAYSRSLSTCALLLLLNEYGWFPLPGTCVLHVCDEILWPTLLLLTLCLVRAKKNVTVILKVCEICGQTMHPARRIVQIFSGNRH